MRAVYYLLMPDQPVKALVPVEYIMHTKIDDVHFDFMAIAWSECIIVQR